MRRHCGVCGAIVDWSELSPIFDGHDPRSVFHGLAMANHSCGATLAEPAGQVFASRVVSSAVNPRVRIRTVDLEALS